MAGVKLIETSCEAWAGEFSTADQTEKVGNHARDITQTPVLDLATLLVEDGSDNQRLISFYLCKAGAKVAIAQNGQVGVNAAIKPLADGERFDVTLIEVQIPDMDGYHAT